MRYAISAVLLGWVVYSVDCRQVGAALQEMQPSYIVLAVLFIAGAVVVSAIKWQCLLRGYELQISGTQLCNIYWMGLFFNNFLPSSMGGDAVRVTLAGRQTGNTPAAAASVVMERLMATAALAVTGFAASFFATVHMAYVQAGFAFLLICSFLLVALLLAGDKFVLFAGSEHKAVKMLRQFLAAGQKLRVRPHMLGWSFIWSLVFQISNVAVNYVLFQGLGLTQVGVWDALFVIPATAVIAMLPVGINGYGLREGGYVALLAMYGVESAAAFSVSILFAFLVSVCSLWGGLLWLKAGKGEQESDERENPRICQSENA